MRSQLMKMRIMQTNAFRGMLYEFGIVLPEGHHALLQQIQPKLAKADDRLPPVVTESVLEQLIRINKL
jgi:transposase